MRTAGKSLLVSQQAELLTVFFVLRLFAQIEKLNLVLDETLL